MRHANRLLKGAAAGVVLLAILSGVANAPGVAADKLLWLIRAMRRLRLTGIGLKDEHQIALPGSAVDCEPGAAIIPGPTRSRA